MQIIFASVSYRRVVADLRYNMDYGKKNCVFGLYLNWKSESVSDCHTLYATLERAKAAMDREIEEAMENFGKGEVLHNLEWLYEFRTEDGYGFTVGIDEMMPL